MRLSVPAFLIVASTILTACAGELFKAYEGPDRPKEEIAILDWSGWPGFDFVYVYRIDGYRIDGKENPKFNAGTCCGGIRRAELLPGKHEIHWGARISKLPHIGGGRGVIDMKAGHVYKLKTDSCKFLCPLGWKGAAWIEDQTTGEAVLGSKILH